MPAIIKLKEILSIINNMDVTTAMKEGFIEYSNGNSVVPPVGELLFDNPPGDVHIKYGYIKNQDYYVVKIASGFYENSQLGVASGQGLMLLFKQQTGELEAVLLDEGYLTNRRTVAAGTLAVQHFSTNKTPTIGIVGTGTIAKMKIQQLQQNQFGNTYWLWGRNKTKADQLKTALGNDFDIRIATTCKELAQNCNTIITTTPSESPLLQADDIKKGTLIVAIGSDTRHKQELSSDIIRKADLVIVDSIPQSKSRGEVYQAVKAGAITEDQVAELGKALQETQIQENNTEQITVVDLTGVAIQDIMIASEVFKIINKEKSC